MHGLQKQSSKGATAMTHKSPAIPIFSLMAGCILLALLCCTVSAASITPVSTPNGIATRQAHLAWTALEKETEMKTAITYVSTLYSTDMTNMSAVLAEFQAEENSIPAAASDANLSSLIAGMRNTTTRFRGETFAQMSRGQGKWNELSLKMGMTTANSPYITDKQNAYWNTRKAGTLADFDAWEKNSQQVLDSLKTRGYDTATAQRTLDVISSRRPDIQSALESRSDIAIVAINRQVIPQTQTFAGQVTTVQGQVPEDSRQQFFIDEGYRAVERADKVNNDLTLILIDIGPPDAILSKTKIDLASSQKVLSTGNLEAAKTPLRLVQEDLVDLAQAYRDVAHSADLPPALSAELTSMAIRLDNTADQLGAIL
jgi:hypothetical protein